MSNKHFNGEEPAEEKKEQHVKQEEATNLQEQEEKRQKNQLRMTIRQMLWLISKRNMMS